MKNAVLTADTEQQTNKNVRVDNNSRPGSVGSEEVVPSRYAVRVGEIDVLVLSDGVLPLPPGADGRDAAGSPCSAHKTRW